MKYCLIFVFLTVMFGLSICIGQTPFQAQDILYLKNGSIIKGTIIELVLDKTVKIQTADGSIFVFTMADVEKITKEPTPSLTNPIHIAQPQPTYTTQPQNEQVPQSSNTGSGSGFTLTGGVSIPTGAFGATTGSKAGAAKTGFAVCADGSLALAPFLAWMSSANLSVNTVDLASAYEGLGVSADAGSWILVWGLTGLKVFGYVSPDVEVFGFGQAGFLFGNIPQLTLTAGTERATQNSSYATSFGFGFGAGITISHVSIGLRYLSGEPEYEITASSTNGGTARGKFTQPTSCVQITGGIAF
jgi:hypothetical protein